MTLWFHRLVQRDVQSILRYYSDKAGEKLANEFYSELMHFVARIAENPERFHFDKSGLRCANLERFPYHALYRVRRDAILILVVRHNKRHPSFGIKRV